MDDELARAVAASRTAFDVERTARDKADAALQQALALSLSDASLPSSESAGMSTPAVIESAAPTGRLRRSEAMAKFGLGDADLFFVKATDGTFAAADVERVAARKRGSAAGRATTAKRPRISNYSFVDERVRVVAEGSAGGGDYVLCVLQLALRVEGNPPLLAAARAARDAGCHLKVAVMLRCRTARHGAFELESLRDVAVGLAGAADACVAVLGEAAAPLAALAAGARAVFCDDCPLEPYRSAISALARSGRTVSAVDSACVVPFRAPEATRACKRAGGFRSATAARRAKFFAGPGFDALDRELLVGRACVYDDVCRDLLDGEPGAIDRVLDGVPTCNRAVRRVAMVGGATFAKKRWASYKSKGLGSYGKRRNDATSVNSVSRLSAHVHYGCISVFAMARDAHAANASKFLDELLVFREMGYAFCGKHEAAIVKNAYNTLPAWARDQLADHADDARKAIAPAALERAESGDVMWDAMQRSLIRHGELHNNLRMTWGKAFLKWSPTPRGAFDLAMRLNDTYALDGLDPNSYTGVAWCFGGFDGPKKPKTTPVTGSLRVRPTSTHSRIRDRYVALVDGAYPAPIL